MKFFSFFYRALFIFSFFSSLNQIVFGLKYSEKRQLNNSFGLASVVALSSDARTLATNTIFGGIMIWEPNWFLDNLVCVDCLEGSSVKLYANALSFSPQGQLLAAGLNDKTVRLWERSSHNNQNYQPMQTLPGHSDKVTALAFSFDRKMLACGCSDGYIFLWKYNEHTKTFFYDKTLVMHNGIVSSLAFSSDGCMLISGAFDGRVMVWDPWAKYDPALFQQVLEKQGNHRVLSVALSPDKTLIAAGFYDNIIRVWKRSSDGEYCHFYDNNAHKRSVSSLTYSPDGKLLLSAACNDCIKLWDSTASESSMSCLDTLAIGESVQALQFTTTSSFAAIVNGTIARYEYCL